MIAAKEINAALGDERKRIELALRERPLSYAVQPIRQYRQGSWLPVRLEWLVRPEHHWHLNAGDFIDGIVSIGLEQALDARVLDDAACFLSTHPDQVLAVNVLGTSFCAPAFADHVLAVLDRWGVPCTSISLEITEHEPMLDYGRAAAAAEQLRQHGIQVGLDDVGAGCYRVPLSMELGMVDYVKLDRALIRDAMRSSVSLDRLMSLIQRARSAQLAVVMEGVESEADARVSLALGVNLAQGYLWDLPETIFTSHAGQSPVSAATPMSAQRRSA